MDPTILVTMAVLWPYPLKEALTSPETFDSAYAFDLNVASEGMNTTARINIGNSKPLAILESTHPEEEAKDHLLEDNGDDLNGEIWCDEFHKQVPDEVEVVYESETRGIYRYKPVTAAAKDKMERKFLKNSKSELTVIRASANDSWRVDTLVMSIDKPFKPNIVAKVTDLALVFSCKPAEQMNNRAYRSILQMEFTVKAAFQTMQMKQQTLISKLERIAD